LPAGAEGAKTVAVTTISDPEALAELTKGGERKLGVALMGLGKYSRGELAPAFPHTRHCRFAGVITGDPAKGAAWSREFGFPERNVWGYDQVGQLAGNPDVDIIYVVSPNGLHAEHTVAAARAGKHVLCEKPLARTAAECDLMLAACAGAGVRLSVGYRLQFDPYHADLERLAKGAMPRLSGEHSWTFRQRAWRIERTLSGGGPLMDVGIYVIQAACRATGALPIAVTARELPKTRPDLFNEVEETIEWTMEFPGGVTCTSAASYARDVAFFRAEGPDGWLHLAPAYAYRGLAMQTSQGPIEHAPVPQQSRQLDDFSAGILTGRADPVPGAMGRDHAAVIDAVYVSSAQGGRRVVVDYSPNRC
jgi:glucose-fructose oxidoreductase